MNLKKHLILLGVFIVAFLVFQIFLGMFLITAYTPDMDKAWGESLNLPSQVEFGRVRIIPSLMIAMLALAIAFGAAKLFSKKIVE